MNCNIPSYLIYMSAVAIIAIIVLRMQQQQRIAYHHIYGVWNIALFYKILRRVVPFVYHPFLAVAAVTTIRIRPLISMTIIILSKTRRMIPKRLRNWYKTNNPYNIIQQSRSIVIWPPYRCIPNRFHPSYRRYWPKRDRH